MGDDVLVPEEPDRIPGPPFGVGWDRLRGWADQYERMWRWRERLIKCAARPLEHDGTGFAEGWDEEFWDTAWAFFQNALSLRDWITYQHPELRTDLDRAIRRSRALSYCADIANGTKHREVTRGHRVPGHLTGLREFAPSEPRGVRAIVVGPDGALDLLGLVDECLHEWTRIVVEVLPEPPPTLV